MVSEDSQENKTESLKNIVVDSNEISSVPKKSIESMAPDQEVLEFMVDCQREAFGIGLGVLTDGTPFLNQRGLARLCGVENAHIGTISSNWNEQNQKPRITTIKSLLAKRGLEATTAHVEASEANGRRHFAYPADICLAILEYYAFEAGENNKIEARDNFRLLAGTALRDFIYTQVGYDPDNNLPERWRVFHDRITLNSKVPNGYFSVFKEISDLIVTMGQQGVHIDTNIVPDISVGKLWGRYWVEQKLESQFGERQHYEHNYPDYFPQAQSNPQPSFCYPEQALGEFRRWVRECYVSEGAFKTYLENQARHGRLPNSFAQLAITAVHDLARGDS